MAQMPRMPKAPKLPQLPKGGASVMIPLIILAIIFGIGWYLEWDRKTIILAMIIAALVYLLVIGIQKLFAWRAAKKIEQQLREQADAQLRAAGGEARSEVEALNQRFDEALQMLRASRMGKGSLYSLPWYVVIGAPGSGKTTCVQESGLNFPNVGANPSSVRGVGGTRNCDWWFTDEAIFLDTAGRYTTDEDDRDEWFSFLDLCKKTRKHRPINGAMVVVSVQDLIVMGEDEIGTYAQTIRERIDELSARLEVVFPIYLVFAKCDMLQGFVDFFETLTKAERQKVWGYTLAYEKTPARPHEDSFSENFQQLHDALSPQRVAALVSEKPTEKKERIWTFPQQFALAHAPLANFISSLFRPNPFQETAILRGVYFSSATQKGTPIDQLQKGEAGDAFSMLKTLPTVPPAVDEKKSYFIHDLFDKIVIPDQTLVRTSQRKVKRLQVRRLSAASIALVASIILLIGLIVSFTENQVVIGTAKAAVDEINVLLADDAGGSVQGNLDVLEKLRVQLDKLYGWHRSEGVPMRLSWGLYVGYNIDDACRRAWLRRVRDFFFLRPDCVKAKLEKQLRARQSDPPDNSLEYDDLYNLLVAYKQLSGQLPPQRELLEQVLKAPWLGSINPGGHVTSDQTEKAVQQFEFFLKVVCPREGETEQDGWQKEDAAHWTFEPAKLLVTRMEELLTRQGWQSQSYRALMQSLHKEDVGPEMLIGGRGQDLIKLNYTFSTSFTQRDFDSLVRPELNGAANQLSEKYTQLAVSDPPSQQQIVGSLQNSYTSEWKYNWLQVLKDADIADFDMVEGAASALRSLADPDQSPIKALLENVWKMRVLTLPEGETVNAPKGTGISGDNGWMPKLMEALAPLRAAFDGFERGARRELRFRTYLEENKLDRLRDAFEEARGKLDEMKGDIDSDYRSTVVDLIERIFTNARRALLAEGQFEGNLIWREEVYNRFRTQFSELYPFNGDRNTTGVSLDVFANMFRPERGTFARTMKMLDTLNGKQVDGDSLVTYSDEFKNAVAHARRIQDAMFQDSSNRDKIAVSFFLTFIRGDGVVNIYLTIGEKRWAMIGRDIVPVRGVFRTDEPVVWAQDDRPGAMLEAEVGDTNAPPINFIGKPWGLHKVLSWADAVPTDSGGIRFNYMAPGRIRGVQRDFSISLVIENQGEHDPFEQGFFSSFNCPPDVG